MPNTISILPGVRTGQHPENRPSPLKAYITLTTGKALPCFPVTVYFHDVRKSIMPKFADDLVAVSVGSDDNYISDSLQDTTAQLMNWAQNEGMLINAEKTKVMMFGDNVKEICIKVNGKEIENVRSCKYLGAVLDPQLNFTIHVDYAVGKSKRAMAKIGTLIDGRKGITVQLGHANVNVNQCQSNFFSLAKVA